jgi:hypothetical protein
MPMISTMLESRAALRILLVIYVLGVSTGVLIIMSSMRG